MKLLQVDLKAPTRTALLTLSMLATVPAYAGLIVDDGLLNTEILGGQLLVQETGNVTATFLGSDAGYLNFLFLDTPSEYGPGFVFYKFTAQETTADLGTFTAGTELVFRLLVTNTANQWLTGDASRNPDQLAHAQAITSFENGEYTTRVGFEDLWGGGDEDFNDFEFSLSNVIDPPPTTDVPEPGLLPLMTLGLLGLWSHRRRRTTA